jgi:hydroxyacylglutathione hydrolase
MFSAMGKLGRLPPETRVFCAHEYTLSNARFAVTVEPENERLRQRFDTVQQARASLQPTVPFRLEEELATNPFLRARDAARLGEIRRAKDVF